MKQPLITQMMIFYHVVDLNSFSKAACRLDVSKAYVSKQITQLEKSMQTKLMERNTRRLALTFAGEQLFEHSRNIVLEYQNAEQTLAILQDSPKGTLRVTAPPGYAAHVLANKMPSFLQKYPDINVDMNLTGEVLDLLRDKIDVAIRLTHMPPADRIAKLIGHYQLQICASNDYLQKNTEPKLPQELIEHACLVYSSGAASEPWPFVVDDKEMTVYVTPRLASNSYETVLQAVLDDCGIARLPSYVIEQAVREQKLKILFNNYMPAKIPIYAVYAQSIQIPPMVRVFIEFLQDL